MDCCSIRATIRNAAAFAARLYHERRAPGDRSAPAAAQAHTAVSRAGSRSGRGWPTRASVPSAVSRASTGATCPTGAASHKKHATYENSPFRHHQQRAGPGPPPPAPVGAAHHSPTESEEPIPADFMAHTKAWGVATQVNGCSCATSCCARPYALPLREARAFVARWLFSPVPSSPPPFQMRVEMRQTYILSAALQGGGCGRAVPEWCHESCFCSISKDTVVSQALHGYAAAGRRCRAGVGALCPAGVSKCNTKPSNMAPPQALRLSAAGRLYRAPGAGALCPAGWA